MSPLLSPRRGQAVPPLWDGFVSWRRPRGAVSHGLEFLVVARLPGRSDRQLARVQQRPQSPVAGWIMRSVHSLVILAEELGALLFGQVPQHDLGIIWILSVDRLGGHGVTLRPGDRIPGRPAEAECPGYPARMLVLAATPA